MGKRASFETKPQAEKALLIGLQLPEETEPIEDSLDELAALAKTAGYEVAGRLSQKRNSIDPSFFLGKGKAEEAKELAHSLDAKVVIVDNDLTPSQQRTLEKVTKIAVIDRTELILRIFADHARTHQSKVQVELAQAQYDLPRLKRMWTHLHREKGGGAFRGGAGERQIELDRRMVRKVITDRTRELETIRQRKQRTMRQRRELFSVALVGYTNAGKSTLMNTLTEAGVLAEDKLFATLDTRTRVWSLSGTHRCLLSDTVGFIKKLPHHLVECFHATLEEAIQADLLIHVVDASAKEPERQIEAVNRVLEQLGCEETPTLHAFNKVDKMRESFGDVQVLHSLVPDAVEISALTGEGVDELEERVIKVMRERELEVEFEVEPTLPTVGALQAFLRRDCEILAESYDDDGTGHFVVRLEQRLLKRLEELQDGIDTGSSGRHKLQSSSGRYRGEKDTGHDGDIKRNSKRVRVRQGAMPAPEGNGDVTADYEPIRGNARS